MAGLDPERLRRLARLAALRLEPGELGRMADEVGGILDHLAAVRAWIGREGERPVSPRVAATGPAAPLRDDGSDPDRLRRRPSEAAPAWRDGFFLVPRLPALGKEGPGGQAEGEGAAGPADDRGRKGSG